APDQIRRIAAVAEKASLTGPLPCIGGQLTGELASPGVFQLFTPVDTAIAQGLFDIATGQTALGQLFANTQRPIAGARAVADKGLQIARLRQQAFFSQTIESGFDQLICRPTT